jgi:hypothetical protein
MLYFTIGSLQCQVLVEHYGLPDKGSFVPVLF